MTPEDARRQWYEVQAVWFGFGEAGYLMQHAVRETQDGLAYLNARLAAHFGRLALGETVQLENIGTNFSPSDMPSPSCPTGGEWVLWHALAKHYRRMEGRRSESFIDTEALAQGYIALLAERDAMIESRDAWQVLARGNQQRAAAYEAERDALKAQLALVEARNSVYEAKARG